MKAYLQIRADILYKSGPLAGKRIVDGYTYTVPFAPLYSFSSKETIKNTFNRLVELYTHDEVITENDESQYQLFTPPKIHYIQDPSQ